MIKYRIFILLLLISLMHIMCQDREETREITAFRTISIPVQWMGEGEMSVEKLTLRRGGVDELPQGPAGFDVMPNGSVVIADPLLRRLVFYDSLGIYQSETPLGMRISRVRADENGTLLLKNVTTSTEYMINMDAQIIPMDTSLTARSLSPGYQVKKTGADRGKIVVSGVRSMNDPAIEIQFKSDSTKMISMQYLGADDDNNPLVALETTRGGETIDIIKIVRKYSEQGDLLCQFDDISLDYFVHPEDEFRVKGDYVYQFIPYESEVKIKVWNTSANVGSRKK